MTKATTTAQINDLIGWTKKKNRAARAARFLVHFSFTYSAKRWREIFIVVLLIMTVMHDRKCKHEIFTTKQQ